MEKNDNELIAEFMGVTFDPQEYQGDRIGRHGVTIKGTQYHESWDWLMPVVEKINNLNMLDYNLDRDSQWLHEKVITTRVNCELQFLYKAVVQFIKWYNSQKGGGDPISTSAEK